MASVRKGAATIRQVAAEAGVSMMTVSAVLRPRPVQKYPVAPTTRERVLAAASKLNYFPSAVASGMRARRMNTLGVVLINPSTQLQTDVYVCAVIDGIIAVANAARQNTTLFTSQHWTCAADSLPVFCDGRTDGLIILSPSSESDIVPALLKVGVPFVLVNGVSDDPSVSSIGIDSVKPIQTLVSEFIALGHRRISLLSGRAVSPSSQQRIEGYRRAHAAAGLPIDPNLMRQGDYHSESGYKQTRELLTLPPAERPTALCCGNDWIAKGALRALKEAGIRVPEEVSVTGFDDMPDAALFDPPLTTVHQPISDLGRRAAEILLENIEAGEPLGIKEVRPTEIVYRRSVAPPPPPSSQTPVCPIQ